MQRPSPISLHLIRWWILFLLVVSAQTALAAERVTAAVAANFAPAMRELVAEFERRNAARVHLVVGSTGKHYAQIRQGAPFDLFFAADAARPTRLEQQGLTVAGSRFTYAVGRLVLWSPSLQQVNPAVLRRGNFQRIAIANPRLAPYGAAAESVLVGLGLWEPLKDRLVRAENVAQAMHFIESGAAEVGFVALAQLKRPGSAVTEGFWLVPASLHAPIEQQAVVLKAGAAAEAFAAFTRTDAARRILSAHGYEAPGAVDE